LHPPPPVPPQEEAKCKPSLLSLRATLVAGMAASARTASAAAIYFFVFDI